VSVDASSHIYYVDSNQHIGQMFFNGQFWSNQDLTVLSGVGISAASGRALTSHFVSSDMSSHVFYLNSAQPSRPNELLFSGPGWSDIDLGIASFKILIDVNQLYPTEANDPRFPQLASDGVWAITYNNPVNWSSTLPLINSASWIVTEDDPDDYTQPGAVGGYAGRPVDSTVQYVEAGGINVLTPAQIDYAAALTGARIVVLARSYSPGDPRVAAVQNAVADPNCSGVVFEVNPTPPSSPNYNGFTSLNLNQGINYVLNAGKKVYLLLPPSGNWAQDGNYRDAVYGAVTNYFSQSGQLANPNLYIVLAVYRRDPNASPPTGVGFLSPDDGMAGNDILDAVNALKTYRLAVFGQ